MAVFNARDRYLTYLNSDGVFVLAAEIRASLAVLLFDLFKVICQFTRGHITKLDHFHLGVAVSRHEHCDELTVHRHIHCLELIKLVKTEFPVSLLLRCQSNVSEEELN